MRSTLTIPMDTEKVAADLSSREIGTLELCVLYRDSANEILKRTGMTPEEFMAGMRQLVFG